ncbi:MAG: septum formation initiator family protein [Methanothrix sp.]|nr:septum formation initiator family protein [Methanothrix sp.]
MPDDSSEQKLFWLLAVVLAGGLLAGVVYPRYHEVMELRSDMEQMEKEKATQEKEVARLREAVTALRNDDDAAWERAVRSRLRYHPAGTAVLTNESEEGAK